MAAPAPVSTADELKSQCVENFRPMSVIVIGAGYSGIYAGIRIPQRLKNVSLTIYEKNAGVGGTWWENRYPGCACDIPAHSYQYTFEPNPNWSTFYAPSVEIRAYLTGVAKKFSVDRFVKCSHRVVRVVWKSEKSKWEVTVERLETGETFVDEADVVISARGSLNDMRWPDIAGFDKLKIPVMHSAKWDEKFDFENKRIGIIGSGSSAIQIIPSLQKVKGTHLSCFTRGRTWISQPFGDHALERLEIKGEDFSPEQKERIANDPEYALRVRTIIERDGNSVHSLTLKDSELQKMVKGAFTDLMRKRLEKKPEILDSILPTFAVGCRRLTPGPGYLEALVEDNVDFISEPIKQVYANGIELKNGQKIDVDVLVCATGFHASAPPVFPVVGENGKTMQDRFHPYPETYLGLATDGFPNYFMMLGPNSAIGTGTLTTMIEAAGDYIIKSIRKMQKENISSMAPQTKRVDDFSKVVDRYFIDTVYLDNCSSWYRIGDRITGLWPGSALHALETLRSPRWEDYDYVYKDGPDGNRLGWLGNGWTYGQVEAGEQELAHFIQPEYVDFPAAPLPENTLMNRRRPFSH